MLGAPLETITMLHHAEELADVPNKRSVHYSAPVKTPMGIEWREVDDIDTSTGAFSYAPVVGDRDSFAVIAEEALTAGIGRQHPIGESRSILFPAEELRYLRGRVAGSPLHLTRRGIPDVQPAGYSPA
jgi:aminoglycoside 3-N-acetyltransferase